MIGEIQMITSASTHLLRRGVKEKVKSEHLKGDAAQAGGHKGALLESDAHTIRDDGRELAEASVGERGRKHLVAEAVRQVLAHGRVKVRRVWVVWSSRVVQFEEAAEEQLMATWDERVVRNGGVHAEVHFVRAVREEG